MPFASIALLPGTKRPTPSTKHQAPGTKHQAPSTKHQAPSTKHHILVFLSFEGGGYATLKHTSQGVANALRVIALSQNTDITFFAKYIT